MNGLNYPLHKISSCSYLDKHYCYPRVFPHEYKIIWWQCHKDCPLMCMGLQSVDLTLHLSCVHEQSVSNDYIHVYNLSHTPSH